MTSKPIYVEIKMRTEMDKLWTHTQNPALHRQWDLRFSDIDYLPREAGEPQRFLYRTRIGFGLDISGTGETRATIGQTEGTRLSTLSFASEQRLSLIREGGGYWKYTPDENGIAFVTQYDYRTRFGTAGRLFDRLLFRPLFGYATAWSFDMLRIWLEKGIAPSVSLQRAFVHYSCVVLLALLWVWHGLVPKLLYPQAGEAELLQAAGWPVGAVEGALALLGIGEIGFAFLLLRCHRLRGFYRAHLLVLLVLAALAIAVDPEVLKQPFNPLTLNAAMAGLGWAAAGTLRDLPHAGNCARSRNGRGRRRQ